MGFLLYLNSSNQSHKGNDMNCCRVEKLSQSRYHTVLNKTKRWQSSLRFTSSFFIGYHILRLLKHLSTLENITTLSLPNTCIIFALKAYFGYRIFFRLKAQQRKERNFALSPLNCLKLGVRLIAKYFHATKFKNVLFSNFSLV